ncbi:hypothetical protein [Halostreptopolyspora alba]|uniref:Uncharacterized protein n=1 Tax=Halostreptopolyspora alba TaxID=2487137 RepID=A0A3N0E972_9ACTN|nr:hypothetical protein EFW17_12635 [Nocardiopsaceae bacterium YIM 96095]
MPIRPANLATMSATIAGTTGTGGPDDSEPSRVTLTFESGYQQVVEGGGCRALEPGEGGVTAVDTPAPTKFALFTGTSCQTGRAVASGNGSVRFGSPILAGAIVLG